MIIEFCVHGDQRGKLISLEEYSSIPFRIKRVYYIYGNKQSIARGFHAHYKLKQVLVCVNGSCKIKLDNGINTEIVSLERPDYGLLINELVWREMYDFSEDAVLLVLASELYDENDYIRDYDKFLKIVKG